ncbi:MAG: 2-hydroxy-6-oxo-6-phenylhexa-2 4-dienoate [Geobacteraceae bacterium]|nr:MAG: 2-hydroxy-6-oxo-6-phenylhexa-2 4-dienoate [Geobacteraceae bacterium]
MPENAMNPLPKDLMLSGKRIHLWTNGTGPPLLLLHSAWGDAEMSWASVWNDLSANFTVIAPDLPGFGASEPLDEPTLAANAEVLKEVLDVQKIDRAIVVGNSFGAAVAIEFASSFPERTLRIVLVNGGYLPVLPAFIRKLISLPVVEKRFRAFIRNMNYSVKAFSKAFPNPAKLPPLFFDRIRRNEEKQAQVVFDTFMRQTKSQAPPSAPATMIWGTGDRLVTMTQAGIIRKWLGKPDFVPIEGAGHLPQVEQPAEFVEAMKKVGGIKGMQGEIRGNL